jgi:hypothetical protein
MPVVSLGMNITQQQEEFSDAFVLAIAAAVGCTTAKPAVDDDSVDWTLSCRLKPRRPKLDLQLKSWTNPALTGGALSYPLKLKNYDDLRSTELSVPRILVLVTLPPSLDDWVKLTQDELILRHSAYWTCLQGLGPSTNASTVNVNIPTTNLFDCSGLSGIMNRLNAGGKP